MSYRPYRQREVKRDKAERRERRAKQQQAAPPRVASRTSTGSAILASLMAAGLIGYAGDVEELRADLALCPTCRVPKLPMGNQSTAHCLCRP